MKYIILPLSLLASICSLHAAQSTTPAPAPAPVVCPPSKLTEAAAIRSYQLEFAAGMYDTYSKLAAQGKLDDNSAMTMLFIEHQRNISSDNLPAHCKAYVDDVKIMLTSVYDMVKDGKYDEAVPIMLKGSAEVSEKHPEAAKLMQDQSAVDKLLQTINSEKIIAEKLAAAGEKADQNKIMAEAYAEVAAQIRALK